MATAKRKGTKATRKPARAPAGKGKPARASRPPKRPAPRRRVAAPTLPMPGALLAARPLADLVEVPARTVLSIDGAGGPELQPFQLATGALYGVAYTLKFTRKPSGGDFKIGPLEARWWAEGVLAASAEGVPPRDTWRWRLRIAVPDEVTEHELADVIQAATMKKGGKLEGSADARRVALERIPAATMGRVLHVGPYAEEPASFEKIRAALASAGRTGGRAHLEIYLSDPRRTKPERLKTGLLLELG